NSLFQTVVTATISNRELIDGLAVEVQTPKFSEQELEDLCMTRQESYKEMEAVEKRLVKRFFHQATPVGLPQRPRTADGRVCAKLRARDSSRKLIMRSTMAC